MTTRKGKAFLVVGHSHWGKSCTLRALTGSLSRYVTIAGRRLHIRRMSNDDRRESFHKAVRAQSPRKHADVIIAFCPVFDGSDAKVQKTLRVLSTRYDIFAFVLLYQYKGPGVIKRFEINELRSLGEVHTFIARAESPARAAALRGYVRSVLNHR